VEKIPIDIINIREPDSNIHPPSYQLETNWKQGLKTRPQKIKIYWNGLVVKWAVGKKNEK
jgi:hypothetical protein